MRTCCTQSHYGINATWHLEMLRGILTFCLFALQLVSWGALCGLQALETWLQGNVLGLLLFLVMKKPQCAVPCSMPCL